MFFELFNNFHQIYFFIFLLILYSFLVHFYSNNPHTLLFIILNSQNLLSHRMINISSGNYCNMPPQIIYYSMLLPLILITRYSHCLHYCQNIPLDNIYIKINIILILMVSLKDFC